MKDNDVIKLGIAIDYPIKWTIEMVVRDLVQNFYDAIGEERFGKEFNLSVKRDNDMYDVLMESKGNDFSFEWLNYVGGSTKTDHPGEYIGMYGEGFKMCMLCLKKLGCKVCKMESQDWSITPCIYNETVAGTTVKMLGYVYNKREDDGFTRFTMRIGSLGRIHNKYDILCYFFFAENELFGDFVVKNHEFSLYKRSSVKCPSVYHDPDFKGILYINGLARARLDIPLIINLRMDTAQIDTRNRKELYSFEANRIISHKAEELDSRTSYFFLIEMRDKWNDVPNGYEDVDTWYHCICNLARNVASNKRYSNMFRKRYDDMYYIDRLGSNRRINKKVREVRAYAKSCGYDKWFGLNPIFRLLGARSIMDEYDRRKQYLYRECNENESNRVRILFDALETIYKPDELYGERPRVVVPICIDKQRADVCFDPLQFADPDYSSKNKRKYNIRKLVIRAEDIMTDDFMIAFISLFNKIIYSLCTQRSNKRAYLLTDLGERIVRNRQIIAKFGKEWMKYA